MNMVRVGAGGGAGARAGGGSEREGGARARARARAGGQAREGEGLAWAPCPLRHRSWSEGGRGGPSPGGRGGPSPGGSGGGGSGGAGAGRSHCVRLIAWWLKVVQVCGGVLIPRAACDGLHGHLPRLLGGPSPALRGEKAALGGCSRALQPGEWLAGCLAVAMLSRLADGVAVVGMPGGRVSGGHPAGRERRRGGRRQCRKRRRRRRDGGVRRRHPLRDAGLQVGVVWRTATRVELRHPPRRQRSRPGGSIGGAAAARRGVGRTAARANEARHAPCGGGCRRPAC
jgi:hypothetical protein